MQNHARKLHAENMKKHEKWTNKGSKIHEKSGKMTSKNRCRKKCEKGGYNAPELVRAVSPRTPTIQQDAPQEIYKSK